MAWLTMCSSCGATPALHRRDLCEECGAAAGEPTDDQIYNRTGVEGGIGYTDDALGSLGENDWRL